MSSLMNKMNLNNVNEFRNVDFDENKQNFDDDDA